MTAKPITFRQLVDDHYRANGYTLKGALYQIHNGAGVSDKTVQAAYRGTQLKRETADKLGEWTWRMHKLRLDVQALRDAPAKKRKEVA